MKLNCSLLGKFDVIGLKILLVSDAFAPRWGGFERHVYRLSLFLASEGFDVHVLTEAMRTDDTKLSRAGVNVIRRLPTLESKVLMHRLRHPFLKVLESSKMAKAINDYGDSFDVVHYHGTRNLFFMNVKTKTPLIATVHGIFPSCISSANITTRCALAPASLRCTVCNLRRKASYLPLAPAVMTYCQLYYNFMKLSLKRLKRVISVSKYIENVLKLSYRLENVVNIYNFVDIDGEILPTVGMMGNFDVRSYLKIPDDVKVILYSGRLTRSKGLPQLLDAFRLILERDKKTFLVITGDGNLRSYIKDIASKLGNIMLTGTLPRNFQLTLMSKSDVFVVPSIYPDACPTAILEAMACGVPVVATLVGGIPELVVNGETGYLVNPNAPDELALCILRMLSNDTRRFRQNSIKRAQMFDIRYLGPKIAELYRDVVEKAEK